MPTSATPSLLLTRDAIPLEDLVDRLKGLLSIGFSAHDFRLAACLEGAIDQVERYTGLLLYPAAVTETLREVYDWHEVTYSPLVGSVTATTLTGGAITATVAGARLTGDYPSGITLTYTAGYTGPLEWPPAIREAVLLCAAAKFDGMERNWKKEANDYRQTTWAA